jgi:hypothetical protein
MFVMGFSEFIQKRKDNKADRKSRDAYDLMITQGKYSTSDTFMIRLQGDVEWYKPFFERIRVEGYDYKLDVIDGELFSPSIIYVTLKKPGTFEKKFNERKD